MIIDKIITLTSSDNWNRLRFLAMERSLRAVGCNLPIWVIPYDDQRFELPENSVWWEIPELTQWLVTNYGNHRMRKYQCFTVANYQFVDTDIIFLRNPVTVLNSYSGFITSDGHWHNPQNNTYTDTSLKLFKAKTTTWQKAVFNSGQFACDQILYTIPQLQHTCTQPDFIDTCLLYKTRDQFAINLLVNYSDVPVTNLTLPPLCMESTWAGDYDGDYLHYWQDENRKPYIMHWAGVHMNEPRPINQLFYSFLTEAEREEWDGMVAEKYSPKRIKHKYGLFQPAAIRIKKAYEVLVWGKH
jgi:hypothetical protein